MFPAFEFGAGGEWFHEGFAAADAGGAVSAAEGVFNLSDDSFQDLGVVSEAQVSHPASVAIARLVGMERPVSPDVVAGVQRIFD